MFKLTGIVFVTIIGVTIWFFGGFDWNEAEAGTDGPQPLPTVTLAATPVAGPTALPTPSPAPYDGKRIRVQFDRGTYGTSLSNEGLRQYELWAREGQVMSVVLNAGMASFALKSPAGADIPLTQSGQKVSWTLVGTGDFILTASATGKYTFAVEIR